MLKKELAEMLKKYQANNEVLSVKWNAGGDGIIMSFYLNDRAFTFNRGDVLFALYHHLIAAFDLPSAGGYYNEGGGVISLENDGKILFEYDEYAYGEMNDEVSEHDAVEEEIIVKIDGPLKELLEEFSQRDLSFYGSASSLPNGSEYFNVIIESCDEKIKKEKAQEIHNEIKKIAVTMFPPLSSPSDIGYSGIISGDEIMFEDLHQLKYYVDKDKKKEKKYLFE